MEQTFEFTRNELIEAFRKWNQSNLDNPENIDLRQTVTDQDYLEAQADNLIAYLENK